MPSATVTVPRDAWTRRDTRPTAMVFIATTLMAMLFLQWKAPTTFHQLDEEPKIAAHLARGHGFRSPLDPSPDAEPTNWAPPIYPLLMAGVYRGWGIETQAALRVMLAINAVSLGIALASVYALGRMVFGRGVGVTAMLVMIANPIFLLRGLYYWDSCLALAIMAALLVAAVGLRRRGGARWGAAAALGAALSLGVQTNVALALTAPVVMLIATAGLPLWRRIGLCMAALLVFLVVLTPWAWRNYAVFDRLILVRGGPHLELWLGNRPGSDGWMQLDAHPSVDPAQGALYRRVGEQAYWQEVRQRFDADYAADPAAFWRRTLVRLRFCFVGPVQTQSIRLMQLSKSGQLGRLAIDVTLSGLALAGAVLLWRRRQRAVLLTGIGLLLAAAGPYLVTHVSYRYLMPVKWLLALAAAVALHALAVRLRCGRPKPLMPACPPNPDAGGR